VMCLQF